MKKITFGVRYAIVLVSLLLLLQSFRVSPLLSEPISSAGALGADPTTISLDPSYTAVPICENFTVNVTTNSVQDLYTWKFDMSFNSTSMKCLDFEEGPFLNQSGNTHFTPPVINNTEGTITGANCSLFGTSSGVSGTGTLASATFYCNNIGGQSTLYVNNIELYNSTSAEIYSGTCFGLVNQIPTVTFRLLAVEKTYTNGTYQFPMRSAEYLIQSLIGFKNWQNGTWGDYNYRSYIHLLSSVPSAQLSSQNMLKYYTGQPNKTSILNEITTFLNDTGPGESNDLTVRIFYYCGHSTSQVTYDMTVTPWKQIPYHYLDLGPPWSDPTAEINETELDQALRSGDLGSSNCTLAILDTCYSGAYVTDYGNLTKPGRVILTATNENEEARGWIGTTTDSTPPLGNWTWFTGNNNSKCDNGTAFGPLGIIGGLFNAEDWDVDGWRSAGEVFEYAENTTKNYSESWANAWNDTVYENGWPKSVEETHPMHPTSWRGVVGGDIPLVMYSERCGIQGMDYTPFCYNGAPQWPPFATFGPVGWSMFGDDAGHGRFSPAKGSTSAIPAWTCPNLAAASSAAVVDGMVFVGSLGGVGVPSSVSALDVTTGQVIWTFSASGTIYSSPAVVDGSVFIGTLGGGGGGGGWLYALNEYTGRVRWEFEAPSGTGIFSSPTVADGKVFISTMQQGSTATCGVYALNETTGDPIWVFPTAASVESSPTCANGRVFIGTMGGWIYALNESSTNPGGQQVWNYSLSGYEIISTVAADSGSIYVGTIQLGGGGGGKVYAFNQIAGGPPEWQFASTSPFSSSPAVDTGKNLVLIGSDFGEVYALNRISGGPVWSSPVGPINMSSVAISKDGLAYIGSTSGTLFCFNETTGAPVWSSPVGGSIVASPALTDQHVIISSMGTTGSVECIGPSFPVHDTAVCSLTASPNSVAVGKAVNITCTVSNDGNVNETFQVTCLYNNTLIWAAPTYVDPTPLYTENVTLSPGTNATITFTWDTTNFAPGSYTIIAIANQVPGETNMADNTYVGGTVEVLGADIAVVNVTVSKTVVSQGFLCNVSVTVANYGGFVETFNVTTYANITIIASQNVTLSNGNSTIVSFTWNTTGFAYGNYTMSAYAVPVSGETNASNNNFTGGWVIVSIPGDIAGGKNGLPDGKVDMKDIATVAAAFGSRPADSWWNANADINNDLKVDMKDIAIVAGNFGSHS